MIPGIVTTNFLPSLLVSAAIFIFYALITFILSDLVINNKYLNKKKQQYKAIIDISLFFLGIGVSSLGFAYIEGLFLNLFLFIPIIFIFSKFFNIYFTTSSFLMLVLIIYLKFQNSENYNEMIMNYIFLALLFAGSSASSFIKWKNNYIYFGIILFIFLIMFSVAIGVSRIDINPSIKIDFNSLDSYFYYGLTCLFALLSTIICSLMISVYLKYKRKSKAIIDRTMYKNDFILEQYANANIIQFIKDYKINQGLVILISFKGINEIIVKEGSSFVNEIIQEILQKIQNDLKEYSILKYMQDKNSKYFFFIKLSDDATVNLSQIKKGNKKQMREQSDILKRFETILKSIFLEIGIADLKYRISPYANCMFFGLQSNDIKEINHILTTKNEINILDKNNIINLLEVVTIDDKYLNQTKNNILNELDIFSPNDIEISIFEYKKTSQKIHFISNAILLTKFLTDKENFYNLSHDTYINNIIMCHISALSIKQFVALGLNNSIRNVLVVDYPIEILCDPAFNISILIDTLASYEIALSNLLFNIKHKNGDIKNLQLNKNLQQFKKMGLNYCFNYETVFHAKVKMNPFKKNELIAQ